MPSATGRLDTVEVGAPADQATFTIIWLHGLGADGHDFVPIVPHLGLDGTGVRLVFPHAPSIPVTINGGHVMPAWYDIRDGDLAQRNDEDGILRSCRQISDLIADERARGRPSERILLAGFSQGGAIALHLALRHPESLAGVLALSTYLVRAEALTDERAAANDGLAIFGAHGRLDPVVPYAHGLAAHERLVELGYAAEWHAYAMQHEVCTEEIQHIGSWLRARIPSA
jgi:phospholipase/carboxylesterase